MHRIIGIALVLTLAVMPVLAATGAELRVTGYMDNVFPHFAGTTIVTPSVSTNPSSASAYVPNFISYRDRSRTASSESDHAAQEDAEPTGILGGDEDVQP